MEQKNYSKILADNTVITSVPTLTTSSNNTSDASGLYKSTATNTGDATYYFRGNVTNNYVSFAGFTWRIVRINEDGTIRMIMQDGINDNTYKFNSNADNYKYMYYSNSEVKTTLENWYQTNIGSKPELVKNVVAGNYFCEQAKVKASSSYTSENATMVEYNNYTPDFKCTSDGNGYGIVNSSVGLITYDEVVYAGGYNGKNNSNYYLYNPNVIWWSMSPAGFSGTSSRVWRVYTTGHIYSDYSYSSHALRPVINLKASTSVIKGNGSSDNPYVINQKMSDGILKNNAIITTSPTLTTSSNNTSDASGLYKSTATNTGDATYYFRGNVENNYVLFAGQMWRIVRINEDGTIRMIMQDGINNNTGYTFNSDLNNYSSMYYTNSQVKTILENWYQENIGNKSILASTVVSGDYYCEQAKVKPLSTWTSGNATMVEYNNYTPNFKCETDGNGKGLVGSSIGLLTYDEVVYAGGYYNQKNSSYYLYNNTYFWTMSPPGFNGSYSFVWSVTTDGYIDGYTVPYAFRLRPVLNLNTTTLITGSGTKSDPYVVY